MLKSAPSGSRLHLESKFSIFYEKNFENIQGYSPIWQLQVGILVVMRFFLSQINTRIRNQCCWMTYVDK